MDPTPTDLVLIHVSNYFGLVCSLASCVEISRENRLTDDSFRPTKSFLLGASHNRGQSVARAWGKIAVLTRCGLLLAASAGAIPVELSELSNLQFLVLSGNKLVGESCVRMYLGGRFCAACVHRVVNSFVSSGKMSDGKVGHMTGVGF